MSNGSPILAKTLEVLGVKMLLNVVRLRCEEVIVAMASDSEARLVVPADVGLSVPCPQAFLLTKRDLPSRALSRLCSLPPLVIIPYWGRFSF